MSDFDGIIAVFDFDGVLANEQELFVDVKEKLLELYNKGIILCIASFNYNAMNILRLYKIDHIFSAWRCGRSDFVILDHSLTAEEVEIDNLIKYNKIFTKGQQISSMLFELDRKGKIPKERIPSLLIYPKVIFFDDDIGNIAETMENYDIYCWSVPIDPAKGIPKNILEVLNIIKKEWTFIPCSDLEKWRTINDSALKY